MDISWQWLAGFTDGDGCISVLRNLPPKNAAKVCIRWTQKEANAYILEQIADFLEIELAIQKKPSTYSVATKGHVYPQAELSVASQKNVRLVLMELLPFLVMKVDQAIAGLVLLDEIETLREQKGHYFRKRNTGGWHVGGPREKDRVK